MATWNLDPPWTELVDIVAAQVTKDMGMTDHMFNLLMENVQYCYNHLSGISVRIGTVTTKTGETGTNSNVEVFVRIEGSYAYFDFVFTIPRGDVGPEGKQGPAGPTGAKILSTELQGQDSNGGNIYKQTFDNGTVATFVAPRGPKGEGAGVTDYNDLSNKPVIEQDLSEDTFNPVVGTYYKHSGASSDTFVKGVIYYYDTDGYAKIDGNYVPTRLTPFENVSVPTKGFRQAASVYVDNGSKGFRMSLQSIKNLNTKIVNVNSLSDVNLDTVDVDDYIYSKN